MWVLTILIMIICCLVGGVWIYKTNKKLESTIALRDGVIDDLTSRLRRALEDSRNVSKVLSNYHSDLMQKYIEQKLEALAMNLEVEVQSFTGRNHNDPYTRLFIKDTEELWSTTIGANVSNLLKLLEDGVELQISTNSEGFIDTILNQITTVIDIVLVFMDKYGQIDFNIEE